MQYDKDVLGRNHPDVIQYGQKCLAKSKNDKIVITTYFILFEEINEGTPLNPPLSFMWLLS